MLNFEITKQDVLTHFDNKILEALDDTVYQDSDGEYHGGKHKFWPLMNEIVTRISDSLSAKLYAEEKKTLQDKIQGKIDEQLSVILNSTYQPVNTWGEPTGAQTTIKEIFVAMAKDYWNQNVDKNGKPSTGWGDKTSRAEYIAKSQIESAFKETMTNEMNLIVKAFKDSLSQRLNAEAKIAIEESLKKIIKV